MAQQTTQLGPHVSIYLHTDHDDQIVAAAVEADGESCGISLEVQPELGRAQFQNGPKTQRFPSKGFETLSDFIKLSLNAMESEAVHVALILAHRDFHAERYEAVLHAYADLESHLTETESALMAFDRLQTEVASGKPLQVEELAAVLEPALRAAGHDAEARILRPATTLVGPETVDSLLANIRPWDPSYHSVASSWRKRFATGQLSTLAWKELPAMPRPHAGGTPYFLGSNLFLVGGLEGRSDFDHADFSEDCDIFTEYGWRSMEPLRLPRLMPALAHADKDLIMLGGEGPGDNRAVYRYDNEEDRWRKDTPMKYGRSLPGAATLSNGKILVVGGLQGRYALCPTEFYDPAARSWSVGPALYADIEAPTVLPLEDGGALVIGEGWMNDGVARPAARLSADHSSWSCPEELLSAFGAIPIQDGDTVATYAFCGGKLTDYGYLLWARGERFDENNQRRPGGAIVAGLWKPSKQQFKWLKLGIILPSSPEEAVICAHQDGTLVVFGPDGKGYFARALHLATKAPGRASQGKLIDLMPPPGQRPKTLVALPTGETLSIDPSATYSLPRIEG